MLCSFCGADSAKTAPDRVFVAKDHNDPDSPAICDECCENAAWCIEEAKKPKKPNAEEPSGIYTNVYKGDPAS